MPQSSAALSIGFSWESDPLNTSRCDFDMMGEEVNGVMTTVERVEESDQCA